MRLYSNFLYLQGPPMLLQITEFPFFVWLNNTPLDILTLSLSIHPTVNELKIVLMPYYYK